MKILTVVGARPQFIKAAVISRELRARESNFREILVHTGQHYDRNMSEVFFEEMGIPRPDYNLGIGGGSHGQNTGRMLEKVEELIQLEKPEWVLVYGDTDSTLAAALAAAKLHVRVAHVEAGLRSFNKNMPEEINRILTDHVSDLLFTPSQISNQNLRAEGIPEEKILITGDVMRDASLFYSSRARKPAWFDALQLAPREYILCTVHRAENTQSSSRMIGILQGLRDSGLPVILPLHPRTRIKLEEMGLALPHNIYQVEPVGYLEMTWLQKNCRAIATDSGGVQKEAYFNERYCVTLREETEWVELAEAGVNKIVGHDAEKIASELRQQPISFSVKNIYGAGDAGKRIIDSLIERAS